MNYYDYVVYTDKSWGLGRSL